jgi:putative peptide zinc metalloprotease protein
MADAWFLTLSDQLVSDQRAGLQVEPTAVRAGQGEEAAAGAGLPVSPPVESGGIEIWNAIRKGLNLGEAHPKANPDVIVRELSDRRGPYFILKNTREKTYLRLSPAEYSLWSQMNGENSIEELIVEHYVATGVFAHNIVARLIDQLFLNHMLVEPPVAVWSQLNQAIQKRSWLYRISAPAKILLTQRLAIKNLDASVGWIYRNGGWLLFTRPIGLVFLLVSLLGLIAFSLVLRDPRHVFLGDNVVPGLALLWVASILPVLVHELGHALTVKHFGREVPKGGVMLFFGLPAAFVETTDIWLEPRRARLAVTWNGPYTGLILGGLASLLLYFFPAAPFNSILFKMAGFAYLTVFINVNPLLKLDGYYLLSDALDIALLREKSMAFVRQKLVNKITQRKGFSREEWIFTVFGLLSTVWSIYALYLAYFFWKTRISIGLQMLLGTGYSLVARLFSILLLAALVSFAVLMILNLFRMLQSLVGRFSRSGAMQRYAWLALVSGGVAVALGVGLPAAFPAQAIWLSGLVGFISTAAAGVKLLQFNRPYKGSPRGLAHAAFAAALGLTGLSKAGVLVPALAASSGILELLALLALVSAGIFLIWPPHLRLGWIRFMLGLLAGAAWLAFYGTFSGLSFSDPRTLVLTALVVAGSWSLSSVWGSARAPAFTLFYLGGLAPALNRVVQFPIGDLGLIGSLLLVAGALHLAYARLPRLSIQRIAEASSQTHQAIRDSVGLLVRRIISQVFFESGWNGVRLLGEAFSAAMRNSGVEINIQGNKFEDPKLDKRTVDELTEVYGLAFNELHRLICQELGREMGTLTFGYGIDLLSWQDREVVAELILSRQDWGLTINQKVLDTRANRRRVLKRVPLFVNLGDEELDRVAHSLKTERFSAGELVIRQGEPGEKFYIIERGSVSVWKTSEEGVEAKQARLGPGQYFGEIALVTNAPRNATIRAETPLVLLSLDHADFDRLVRGYVSLAEQVNTNVRYSWLLRGMPIFDELASHELDLLAARLQPETFRAGEVIFREGESGDKFYIIESGQVLVTQTVDGAEIELSRRGPGEYFGEIALIQDRPRTATITAVMETNLLSLEAGYFHELVSGHLLIGQAISRTGTRRLTSIVTAA